jgi:hypothetical protein
MLKNQAGKVAVFAWDGAAGAPKTGDAANITAKISIDGGSAASVTDTNPVEIDDTDMPGVYVFDLSASETNGDMLVVQAVSSSNDISIRPVTIYTRALGELVEGSLTTIDVMRILLAAMAGKTAGGGTQTLKFRDLADTKDRILATVDTNRNRTSITLDPS